MKIQQTKALSYLSATVAIPALICCGSAQAQVSGSVDASSAGAPNSTSDFVEIVVTAERRSNSIQRVPMAVTAMSSAEMEARGVAKLEDALVSVPGVSFSSGSSTRHSYLAIRGVLGPEEEPAVGLYLDNVYIGRRASQAIDFIDPQSVQVLRGPQGALYGRNTLGGAILVETRAPSLERPEGYIDLSVGNYSAVNAKTRLSAPLGDKFAVSLGGRFLDRNGYFRNLNDGKRVGENSAHAVIGAFRYQNGPVNFVVTADYDRTKSDGSILKLVRFRDTFNGFAPAPAVPAPLVIGPTQRVANVFNHDVNLNRAGSEDRELYGVTANLTLDLDAVTIKSTSAWRGFNIDYAADSDGSAADIFFFLQEQKQRQVSQEITLSSNNDGRLEWILGGSYFHERFKFNLVPLDVEARVLNIKPLFLAGLVPIADVTRTDEKTESIAAYGQLKYKFASSLSATVGLRYAHDKRSIDKSETLNLLYGTPAQVAPPALPPALPVNPVTVSQSDSWSELIPEAILQWQPSKNLNAYIKATRSYRPGGYNEGPALTTNILFRKETAWQYEAGVRGSSADRSVSWGLTGFYIDWKDQQVNVVGAIGFVTANANSHSMGLEADMRWNPVRNLTLGGAVSWLAEAQFDNGTLSVRDPNTGVAANVNVAGQRLARAPKWSGSAYGNYVVPLQNGADLNFRLDYALKSAERTIQGRSDLISPTFGKIDARISYEQNGLTLSVFGKNLANDSFLTFAQSVATFDLVSVSDPRTFGLGLSYRF
tara:strand:+ start:536 stop:2830 length:2295 start_codon:yes stop_codon:yes gene_type:complete